MISAPPSTSIEVTAEQFATGLVGTIGVRITDGQGGTTTARTTSGIVEHPSGSGIYTATITTPGTAGQYLVVWDNGSGVYASEDLTVTATALAATATGGRSGMADLILRVRGLSGAGTADHSIAGTDYFSDLHIQEALDRHRLDVVREQLVPREDYIGGGSVQWREYASRFGQFESTTGGTAVFVVEDGRGSAAGTASYSADYQRGLVTFSADQGGTAYYLTGRSYDVYGAAADVVEQRASAAASGVDFSTDNMSVRRSQGATQLTALAGQLRRKARSRVARGRRTDGPAC